MEKEILEDFIKNNQGKDIYKIINNLWIEIDFVDYIDVNWCCIDFFWKSFILINKNLSQKLALFTIWHELCHFLLWEKWFSLQISFNKKDFIERRADRFALDLLIPTSEMIELVEVYNYDIFQLENYFWIPAEKIAIKLKDFYKNLNFYF